MNETEYLAFLLADGYREPRLIDDGIWAAIKPFLFTYAIVVGEVGDQTSYLDRWCYKTEALARMALHAWDGNGEPCGWHRHPSSGRRVSDDPATLDGHGNRVPVGQMYHYL